MGRMGFFLVSGLVQRLFFFRPSNSPGKKNSVGLELAEEKKVERLVLDLDPVDFFFFIKSPNTDPFICP